MISRIRFGEESGLRPSPNNTSSISNNVQPWGAYTQFQSRTPHFANSMEPYQDSFTATSNSAPTNANNTDNSNDGSTGLPVGD